MKPSSALIIGLLALAAAPADARVHRSSLAVREFRRDTACPSTGLKSHPCPGYVVDHLWPLCADGADKPYNMAWQEIEASKRKDRWEKELCRSRK